jgi:hypothetical protein
LAGEEKETWKEEKEEVKFCHFRGDFVLFFRKEIFD